MFAVFSHNGHCAPAVDAGAGRFFRANLAYGKFLLNLAASIWRPILPKLDPIPICPRYWFQKQHKICQVFICQVDKIFL